MSLHKSIGTDPFGGLMEGIFGGPSRGQATQQISTFQPSATSQQISQLLQSIFGGGGGIPGQIGGMVGQPGALFGQLEGELTSPTFGPTTASEQSLLDSLMSQTQGASAVRGLGPATQGALAQTIAPTLVGMRQQRIGNLLGGAGLGEQARRTDLMTLLSQLGLDLQGLGLAAGISEPSRIVTGQRTETGARPGLFGQLFGGSGGSSAGEFGGVTGLF